MPQGQQYYQAGPQEGGVMGRSMRSGNNGQEPDPPKQDPPPPPPGGGPGADDLPMPWRRLWGDQAIPRVGGPPPGGGGYTFLNPPSGDFVDAGANPGGFRGGWSGDFGWGRFFVEGGLQGWTSPDPGSGRNFPYNWHPHAFGGVGAETPFLGGTLSGRLGGLLDIDNPYDRMGEWDYSNSDYGATIGIGWSW